MGWGEVPAARPSTSWMCPLQEGRTSEYECEGHQNPKGQDPPAPLRKEIRERNGDRSTGCDGGAGNYSPPHHEHGSGRQEQQWRDGKQISTPLDRRMFLARAEIHHWQSPSNRLPKHDDADDR